MGLRDAFRSLRGGNDGSDSADAAAGGQHGEQDILEDGAEASWFVPRTDGEYSGPQAGGLRFLPGGRVRYRPEIADGAPLPTEWSGEYTAAGRFSVQAPFERPVTFAVLQISDDGFTARRTDTRDRSAMNLDYRFAGPAGA